MTTLLPLSRHLRIDRVLHGGEGLGRSTDSIGPSASVPVPFTLPGELVELGRDERGSETAAILEPSPERVLPRCPHFGACGGCHLQMASYPEQLRIKQRVLQDALDGAGVGVVQRPAIAVHAAEPWGYRNRIRLRIERVEQTLRFGYTRRGEGQVFLPISTCPIAAPMLWAAAETLLALATVDGDLEAWLRAAREVELSASDDLARVQVSLLCPSGVAPKPLTFTRACDALGQALRATTQLAGAGAIETAWRPLRLGRTLASWGAPGLNYTVITGGSPERYWVARGGFFQVNRFLLPALLDLVCAGRSGALAWDLFAGVGLFSRVLARSFARVTAVEASPEAARELKSSLGRLGPEHKAEAVTTVAFLRAALTQRERPELIVLDPPRAGGGKDVCDLLRRIAAPELIYVSCDPVTLARDLAFLQADYDLTTITLVDLFPQTYHQEAVVTLRRRG